MAKKKLKLPLAYRPVGFVLGWAGGALAGLAFRATWKAIRHEDEAPEPLDENRRWGEILLAAAVQGAIFAVVRGAVDRAGATAVERSIGVWPAKVRNDHD
ncbi:MULTISPECIES: DUF4235 domain-containing protein [unclassified Streptomyces]|uniref:DUF4235 domain-containing protein n=1 Tax=unclassified Streptomyces TaxID=2593676 RepID=UPI000C2716E8|nr:DUF4235 domain-containing protein [Streptomyces sp. CB01373]PJM92648.1 hypothetical protein CG719_27100 [Streptomyces sp. CB01373]